VGEGDCDPEAARERLGPAAIVGVTVHDAARADRARSEPVSYAGVGAVFGTTSKGDRPVTALGLDGLAALAARMAPLPTIAIGGIDPSRVRSILSAGAAGVAVLSWVVLAPDPREATRALRDALDRADAEAR
jgi:thiamine-phosphate pyrophosphorylase